MSAGPATAPRTTLDLKVRVWGMGSNDRPFFQNAVAQNISATGACIYGIEQQLKVGDVIGVQHEAKKARCKVIWVVDAGGVKKTQVGVQLVADQECPWLAILPKEATDSAPAVRAPDNRRKFLRHKISFPLQLRDERVNTPMRANATDISGNGCYVESAMPVAVGTSLRIEFWIDQESVTATATVRTRDPGVGMGIEFTGLTEDTKARLQAHLDKLDPGITNLGRKSDSPGNQ